MDKEKALSLFGGIVQAADAIGISRQAIDQWPGVLPARIADRVLAACVRSGITIPAELASLPTKEGADA